MRCWEPRRLRVWASSEASRPHTWRVMCSILRYQIAEGLTFSLIGQFKRVAAIGHAADFIEARTENLARFAVARRADHPATGKTDRFHIGAKLADGGAGGMAGKYGGHGGGSSEVLAEGGFDLREDLFEFGWLGFRQASAQMEFDAGNHADPFPVFSGSPMRWACLLPYRSQNIPVSSSSSASTSLTSRSSSSVWARTSMTFKRV